MGAEAGQLTSVFTLYCGEKKKKKRFSPCRSFVVENQTFIPRSPRAVDRTSKSDY